MGTIDDLFSALGSVAPDLAARVRNYSLPRGVIVDSIELLAPGESRGVHLALVKVAPLAHRCGGHRRQLTRTRPRRHLPA